MDADTRLHNSKWLIRVNQSPHLTKDRFACRAIGKDKIAVCEKTAGVRSGNSSDLDSACLKALVPVEIFQFSDMHNGLPSVIKDSTHFLQRLEDLGHILSTAILCTMDVVGLYPHIPHSEGLEALRLAMNKAGDMPVDDLVSLAKLVSENNFF